MPEAAAEADASRQGVTLLPEVYLLKAEMVEREPLRRRLKSACIREAVAGAVPETVIRTERSAVTASWS